MLLQFIYSTRTETEDWATGRIANSTKNSSEPPREPRTTNHEPANPRPPLATSSLHFLFVALCDFRFSLFACSSSGPGRPVPPPKRATRPAASYILLLFLLLPRFTPLALCPAAFCISTAMLIPLILIRRSSCCFRVPESRHGRQEQ